MGGCVNKTTNNVITMRINEQNLIQKSGGDVNLKLKKPITKAISMDVHSQKFKKINLEFTTNSSDISKIVSMPDVKNNENDLNNFNSLREIVELFDCKYEKKMM